MLKGTRALIIEDEPLIAMELESLLLANGAEVAGVATTIEEAKERLRDPDFALAIVDLKLHGESVRSVIQGLADRGIKMIFYSGYDDTTTARSWAAVPLVVKPADGKTILRALESVLKQH